MRIKRFSSAVSILAVTAVFLSVPFVLASQRSLRDRTDLQRDMDQGVSSLLTEEGLTKVRRLKQPTVVEVIHVAGTEPFDIVPSNFGGPFYVGGTIVDPDTGEPIGLFHCWGFFFAGGTEQRMVTQEFDLFDRGKIILTGREGPAGGSPTGGSPRAITGGTGDFRNGRGQATFGAGTFGFRVTFEHGR